MEVEADIVSLPVQTAASRPYLRRPHAVITSAKAEALLELRIDVEQSGQAM